MKDAASKDFRNFIVENRAKINRNLNVVLWAFIVTGPAIAIGLLTGVFSGVTYATCWLITGVVVVLAGLHLLMLKKFPRAIVTSAFALTALDVLIAYAMFNYIDIRMAWFLVPLLSILFCDMRLYCYALVLNYAIMCVTMWFTAPASAALRINIQSVASYFLDVMGAMTIEMLVMAVSGFIIVKLSMDHYRELFLQNGVIREKEESEAEKLGILDSMAGIYDNVNLVSFLDNTEMSLRDANQEKHGIDMSTQTHTLMNQRIKARVVADQLESFLTFTNITTVQDRLANRKIISADFIDVVTGWFRAQYITVERGPDGRPNVVIFTTRNVDEEKRREEHLIRLSMTDEMTRLYNRRCYDEDLTVCRSEPLADDFVLFSIDINGLKTVNDTKGHLAGDELIKGAANCLLLAVDQAGKAYRTGGDEFMAVVHTKEPEEIRKRIKATASEWHGVYTDVITVSCGYAAVCDHPGATVDDLEQLADADMYAEKERYYQETGAVRRRTP